MAMGITQALKLQEGPIDALAQLPQQQLIAMAQQGRISAEVLPIILNEKAQMAQQIANMQAAQQPPQPSVIEQAMAINAQAEAQPQAAMMPAASPLAMPTSESGPAMAPATEPGLTSLNVPEDMYSMAGGGIVAFAGDGRSDVDLSDIVSQQQREDPYFRTAPQPKSFSDFVQQYQELTAPFRRQTEEETELQRYLKEYGPRTKAEQKQQNWMRALEAGLGIMAETSPYALSNIGKGSQTAVKGFAEDVKERRKQELAYLQASSDAARKRREEQLADVTGGLGMYQKEQDRELREREIDLRAKQLNQPPEVIRSAMAIRRPGEPLIDAVTRYTEATSKADRYNAISNRLAAANKAFYESSAYSMLSAKLRDAKTDADRTKIQNQINALQTKYQDDFEISAGDRAFLRSVNSKLAPQKTMTMADVKATAQASGKSEAEVIAAAKAQGYTIQ